MNPSPPTVASPKGGGEFVSIRAAMSNVNIKRAVANIRANTTVYTPIVEVIVNAIQALAYCPPGDGKISVRVERDRQFEIGGLPEIHSLHVQDNGIGFTDVNREAFDTLYTDAKITEGGKGFGRFVCLKYFEDLHVDSVYFDSKKDLFRRVTFSMGKDNAIIVGEKFSAPINHETGSTVHLSRLKKSGSIDKKLTTIARSLVERLLPYLISDTTPACPVIVLSEKDGSDSIILNDFVSNELSAVVQEVPVAEGLFALRREVQIDDDGPPIEEFRVRVFRLYFPKHQKSKISLVAHKREVTGSALSKYIPEFSDEFYERGDDGEDRERNYIVKAYVFSAYLDRTVALERCGFEFQMDDDALFGISQSDIETRVAEIAREAIGSEITIRQEKKKARVQSYIDTEAPWHKDIAGAIDLRAMPYHPSNEDIEERLQREKFYQEVRIKREVAALLADNNDMSGDVVQKIVGRISEASKNDLVHYIALRRNILEIFERSLQTNDSGVYESEGVVHDVIFPRRGDSETTPFYGHNLWIIDERLNFTNYVASDIPLNNQDRPDLIVYNRRVIFRGENEASNPITVFEFKKPKRDDFVNPSSKEDPVQQIVRYVNSIRRGEYTTPKGRPIQVADNTPFYGYVVCELTKKVKDWLRLEKDFTEMPDGLGWFLWIGNIKLYVEVVSWDKILKDAEMRNKVFFHKLGI